MGTKTRLVMMADLQIDLGTDAQSGEWTDTHLYRAIERAVFDLSRFIPREMVYEKSLQFTVTDESWTSDSSAGTYVALANKPIKWESETVTDSGDNACKRNTDYYMDYANGKITHISGGEIDNSEASCKISYTIDQLAIDLSSLTGYIRYDRIEYPIGNVPQDFINGSVWGDVLWISGGYEGQEQMSEGSVCRVYYQAEHTGPDDTTAGTFPSFLDATVELAASAYALFQKAIEREHQVITDIASARTQAAAAVTALAAWLSDVAGIETALDKVDTYLATAASNGATSSAAILAQIATDVTHLRTAIQNAFTAGNAYLDEVDTTDLQGAEGVWVDEEMHLRENIVTGAATSTAAFTITDTGASFTAADVGKIVHNITDNTWAVIVGYTSGTVVVIDTDIMASTEKYAIYFPQAVNFLSSGKLQINTVTIGADVPERYASYADRAISIARSMAQKRQDFISIGTTRTAAALGYLQEAAQRVAHINTYIDQSSAYGRIAAGFVSEAEQRINVGLTYVQEAINRNATADRYFASAGAELELADGYKADAIERRNEAWSIWRDPKQYMGNFTLTALRQPPR